MLLLLATALAAELDPVALNTRVGIAATLVAYDVVAWTTSDALVAAGMPAGLDGTWFVVDPGLGPTGYYGRYDAVADGFVQLAAFRMASDGGTEAVSTPLPAAVADPRGRAVRDVRARLPKSLTRLQSSGVNPNLYVLEADDGGLDVWVLPSLAPNGQLVVAPCARYHYDATGSRRLDASVEKHRPRAYTLGPQETILLDSVDRHTPTVCELYWAYYYADDVARIQVETNHLSVMFSDVPGTGRVPIVAPR